MWFYETHYILISALVDTTHNEHTEPEYVNDQFQCYSLDVVVEVALPRSSLRPLLVDVNAACMAALIQIKMNLQRLAPAKDCST